MAKKSAISGEYIITIEDSGSVRVCKIYDNVKGSLREIAELKGFQYDPNWTTHEFGRRIVKEFGDGKMAEVGEYVVTRQSSGKIETYRTYDNTKGELREIAETINFEYDPNYTTRQFGSKLVNYINENK